MRVDIIRPAERTHCCRLSRTAAWVYTKLWKYLILFLFFSSMLLLLLLKMHVAGENGDCVTDIISLLFEHVRTFQPVRPKAR